MLGTGMELSYKPVKCFVVVAALIGFPSTYADEVINYSNCIQHLGGGGFGDFECYEDHAGKLEADNGKVFDAIKSMRGVAAANKIELTEYMREQDNAAKACDLAIKMEYPSQEERAKRDHIELYDVMAAHCRYSLRKQQNDFLRDLYSVTNGQ